MRSQTDIPDRPAKGSAIWTAVGWLGFAVPLVAYALLRLS